MSLVGYLRTSSSSGEESDTDIEPPAKTRRASGVEDSSSCKQIKVSKFPLPAEIKSLFSSGKDCLEDPAKHQGRIRTFSHEVGNWASLVYIPVSDKIESLLQELGRHLIAALESDYCCHLVDDFHVSLSRTFVIRHHWINDMCASLQKGIELLPRCVCTFGSGTIYCNDEKTRSFLGLTVTCGHQELNTYVNSVDKVLQDYKLPMYYQNPSFHISIIWFVGDISNTISPAKLSQINSLIEDYLEDHQDLRVKVKKLCFKTGKKEFMLSLKET